MKGNIGSLIIFFILCGIEAISQNDGSSDRGFEFIENKGQWPAEVKYYANIPGGEIFVQSGKMTLSFIDKQQYANVRRHDHREIIGSNQQLLDKYALVVAFEEANGSIDIEGLNQLSTKYNYFFGKNQDDWTSGARAFRGLTMKSIYDGIDLSISSVNGNLKYDLHLQPGANPECIKISYAGATSLSLKDNRLIAATPFGTITEAIPASYALCNGQEREIGARYSMEDNIVSFKLTQTDPEESVLIDPLLVFSTYSGSVADNWGNTATFDDAGNAYAGGMTNHTRGGIFLGEFPATPGAYQTTYGGNWDVAIMKFDSTGSNLLYATYLGGSDSEVPQSLLVNPAGELLILGITSSLNFPITSSSYDTDFNGGTPATLIGGVPLTNGSDIFVAKLSADGSQLLSSTLIGGIGNDGVLPTGDFLARNYGDESRGDIAVDNMGNVIIISRTSSLNFPTVNAFQMNYGGGTTDAIVFKFTSDLSDLLFSTYLGGIDTDVGLTVKVDSLNNIFVAGGTSSSNFPVTTDAFHPVYGGLSDGWVSHLTQNGDSLIASTYIGTDSYDQVFFMDLDNENQVYLAGQTTGQYPVSPNIFSRGTTGTFLQKINFKLDSGIFSTVINTEGRATPAISLTAFLVNECNNIYLSGWGSPSGAFSAANRFQLNTTGLPVTSDAFQTTTDGSSFYLIVLTGDASEQLYGTFLGDINSLVHVDGGTSRFDKHGIVYHSVCASCFEDTNSFPTTEGAWSQENGSTGCNNAIFKFDLASLRARILTNSVTFDDPGVNTGCLPFTVAFENRSTGGEVFDWNFGDGNALTTEVQDTVIHTFMNTGTFQVELRAFDSNTCVSEDITYTTITVTDPNFSLSSSISICRGDSVQLLATGGIVYQWSPADSLSNPIIANPFVFPSDTIMYHVLVTNISGCIFEDSLTVYVVPEINLDVNITLENICEGQREVSIINESTNIKQSSWLMGDGTTYFDDNVSHVYAQDGVYNIRGILINEACTEIIDEQVNVSELFVPNILTRNGDGKNDRFKIKSGNPVNLKIMNRWGNPVYEMVEYDNSWTGKNLNSGMYFYEVILQNREICTGWIQLLDGK